MKFKLRKVFETGWRAKLAAFLLICAGSTANISGQDDSLFDTKPVELSIKHKYRLTNQELKTLQPILRQQNQELVIVLDRCMDEDQTDYFSLWNKILEKREEFESVSIKGMTRRQTQVLRAARHKFELRILNEWRSFYVEELSSFLELDWFQASMLEKLFQKDQDERLKMIGPSNGQQLERFWQKLSKDLEKQLERILTPDQLKDYRKLNSKVEELVA